MLWAGRYVTIDLKIKLHSNNAMHTAEGELKCITVIAIYKTEN